MSHRREQKEAARQRRVEAEHAAQQRAAHRQRLAMAIAGAVAGVAVVGIVVLVAGAGGGSKTSSPPAARIPAPKTLDLATAAERADGRFISYDYAYGINDHVPGKVSYPTNPPTNGPHFPEPAKDGDYAGAVTPPTEQLVHAMEHGRVEIQYRTGLPKHRIAQLVALYNEDPHHVLLFENKTNMPCEVAVTAWGHGMLCPKFTDAVFDAVRAFREQYRDKGPELIP
jgi:hypothetical protein